MVRYLYKTIYGKDAQLMLRESFLLIIMALTTIVTVKTVS